jgi:hypothetical protein
MLIDDLPPANLALNPQLEVLEDAESFGLSLYSGTERVSEAVLIDRMYRYIFGHSSSRHVPTEADADALNRVRQALQAHRDPAAAQNVRRLLGVINKIEKEILEALVVEGAEVVAPSPLPELEVKSKAEKGAPAFVELVTRTPEAEIADLYQAVFGHSLVDHPYNYEQDVATLGQLWSDIDALGQSSSEAVDRAYVRLSDHLRDQHEERRIAKVLSDHPVLQGLTDTSFKPTSDWLQQAEQALNALEDSEEAPPRAVSTWRSQLDAFQAQPPKAEKSAEKSQDQFAGQPELQFLNTVDIQALPATPAGMDQLLAEFGLVRLRSGGLPTENLRRRFDQLDQAVTQANLRHGDRRRLGKKLEALRAYSTRGVEQETAFGHLERFGRLGARWLTLRGEARQAFLANAAINEREREELIRPIVKTLGLRGSVEEMKAQLTNMLRLGQQYKEAARIIASWGAEEQRQITAGLDLAQAALNLPPLPEPQRAEASATTPLAIEAPPEAEAAFEPASDQMIVSYLEKALEIDPDNAADLWQVVGGTFNLLFERLNDHAALVESLVEAPSNNRANKIKALILSRLNGELDRLLPADSPDEQVAIVRRVFDDYFEAYATQLRNP